MSYVDLMALHIFGIKQVIVPSPESTMLKKYGGPYSIAEFREKHAQCHVIAHKPLMVTHPMVFEERPVDRLGYELDPYASAPISSLAGEVGKTQWNVRGLRLPRTTTSSRSVAETAPRVVFNEVLQEAENKKKTAETTQEQDSAQETIITTSKPKSKKGALKSQNITSALSHFVRVKSTKK
jgi:hypothetical protein